MKRTKIAVIEDEADILEVIDNNLSKEGYEVCSASDGLSDFIERAVNTLSVSRYMDRIADLSTNIAQDVVFMVEGESIRHQK